tara:strand:+ start:517 stop:801 length:285 start_codon:yes stop_codon:yes gene_type:complete
MGLGVGAVQNILELNNLGYFKNSKNVIEIGSQNLHLNIAGFNRAYLKETLSYNYVPSATVKLDDTSVVVIFRELYKWFKKKTKKIIRILIMKFK